MPKDSILHKSVHEAFRDAFGEPDNTLGRDDHWSLHPSPKSIIINVLVNGTAEFPAVWVFDPNDSKDGVLRELMKTESDIARIIKLIDARLEKAAKSR